MKVYITFLIVYLCSYVLYAQSESEELITDRPDQTESSHLVPKGTIQVETGFVLEEDHEQTNYTYNTSLFRIGINEHFEFRVITELIGSRFTDVLGNETTVSGLAPFTLGTKIFIAEADGWIPQVAFFTHVTFRNGKEEFKQDYIASDFRFAVEYDLGDRFSLGTNLGVEWGGVSPNATGIYTLVLGMGATERLGFFAEFYGFVTEQIDQPDHRFNGGLTYLIADRLQFDFSAGVGISDISPDHFISTGLSFRLPH